MERAVEAAAVGLAAAVGGDGDRVGGLGRLLRGCGLGAAPLAERGEVDGAVPVDDFGGDGDFGGFDGAEEIFAGLEGLRVVVAGAEVFELLVLLVDFAAGADVDEEGDEDRDPRRAVSFAAPPSPVGRQDLPDRPVEDGDAENVPLRRDPTPQRRVSVHTPLFGRRNEEQNQGDDEGGPVAKQKIGYLHPSQLAGVKLEVKGKIDVHGHG